ncbi:MAG: energy-coupling factor transporter transmembrane protein EcfT [Lachnospiraceae bacterium]|nr:energy-coupling factor transporter transmembrane protein EcfT [Lachnospiraceae bacterium]
MDACVCADKTQLHLDPRTKLFMVFVVSTVVLVTATTPFTVFLRTLITFVPLFLLILEGRALSALGFALMYGVAMFLMHFFISQNSSGIIMALLVGYCGIVVQFMPAMICAWYMVKTTKIGEFMSAMQKMHVPDGITISLAVIMRFFPTIKEEYGAIRDAMRMRGIMLGGGNPGKIIEFRMIPLLFSCVSIGDELSCAAITRGLGANVKRTSTVEIRLTSMDYLVMAGFLLIAIVFIMAKYTEIL